MRPTHTERTAPLYARLLIEEAYRLRTQEYLVFLRQQVDSRPTSRGYCYYLAMQELPCD